MSGNSLLQTWIGQYCAPVVVTIATAEAEKMCLQNGLLLHELLSCFGHLVDINVTIRINKQPLVFNEAHIRFERATEVKSKATETVESLLSQTFSPFDINRLPSTVQELKSAPPTAWTNKTEQIVARSLSFSEFEMISQPVVILTVVASTDVDPVAAMQELTSMHHTPTCFSNGQYDPSVQRVFVLLDDANQQQKDALSVLRQLTGYFPANVTKMVTINSLPITSPNLRQPDMWSRYLIPKYYPQHAPAIDVKNILPLNENQEAVIGCRLSGDDFMKLQDFCIWLFSDQIAPALERRIAILTHQVNEARKGVKNVLKSFWRKPRDESDGVKGGVKYRYDKIETQILLLADTSFMVKDYETALSMYRLVKDDYKADRAMLHYCHTCFMIALCILCYEPHKYKEAFLQIDQICQVLSPQYLELPHAATYLALLSSEVFIYLNQVKTPLESARILLVASGALSSKYPLQGSLLMERAAIYYLQASQVRKYVFHQVLTGNRLLKCGIQAARHGTVCFASAMLLLEKSGWSDIKAKLCKLLARDLRSNNGQEGARRSLLCLLKTLTSILGHGEGITNLDMSHSYTSSSPMSEVSSTIIPINSSGSLLDAVSVLNEIMTPGLWGSVRVLREWSTITTRDILLGNNPMEAISLSEMNDQPIIEVWNLPVPGILLAYTKILTPINGNAIQDDINYSNKEDLLERDLLLKLFDTEDGWMKETKAGKDLSAAVAPVSLEERWIRVLMEDAEKRKVGYIPPTASSSIEGGNTTTIPLGEKLMVKLTVRNKLPVEIIMNHIQLVLSPKEAFEITEIKELLGSDDDKELILTALPKAMGKYEVDTLGWQLSNHLRIKRTITKSGPLLQRTQQQRAQRLRGKDTSLCFEVIEAQPLLSLIFEGLSSEVLQGQLLKTTLILKNVGSAMAKNIYLKLSEPFFVFFLPKNHVQSLEFYGKSCSILDLTSLTIAPGEELRLDAWLRIVKPGLQKIHLLAIYDDGMTAAISTAEGSNIGSGNLRRRNSFLSVTTKGLPSIGLSTCLALKTNSSKTSTLVLEVNNYMNLAANHISPEELRMSSFGQIDLPKFDEEFADVDGNCVKVLGILATGGVSRAVDAAMAALTSGDPSKRGKNKRRNSNTTTGTFQISPLERFTTCYRVENTRQGQQSWLLDLQQHRGSQEENGEGSSSSSSTSSLTSLTNQLKNILERFICTAHSMDKFQRSLLIAKLAVEMEELEAATLGPRSISDVRRERQQQIQQQKEEDRLEAVKAALLDQEDPASSADPNKQRNGSAAIVHHSVTSSATNLSALKSLQAVSQLEYDESRYSVAAIWVCRWQEKIRWGMHHIPQVAMQATLAAAAAAAASSSSSSVAQTNALFRSPSPSSNNTFKRLTHEMKGYDAIHVAIAHKNQMALTSSLSSSSERQQEEEDDNDSSYYDDTLYVSVIIRSLTQSPLYISLKAVDGQTLNLLSAELDAMELGLIDSGIFWIGKSQYEKLLLSAHGSLTLPFRAKLSKKGVINLNRFLVKAVSGGDGSEDLKADFRLVRGQSLVQVT